MMAHIIGKFLCRNATKKLLTKSCVLKNRIRHASQANTLKVTILGAGGNVGKSAALMLKQSVLIDELCLYDTKALDDLATDLSYIDTKCVVKSYLGAKDMPDALSASNVIIILVTGPQSESSTGNALDRNGALVKDIAVQIAKHSPKSFVAIATEPINSIVPLFSEVMKKHGNYNPHTIFGITTVDIVRSNRFVAEVLGLEPECVVVPVIGGHTEKTLIPVLSKSLPCNEFTIEELEDITGSVKQANENILKIRSNGGYLTNSFAISRFVLSLVKAIRGQGDIVECAYVKSSAHPKLKYMATPLLLGPSGIMKDLGIPDLSDFETCLLDNAIPILMEDIKKGEFAGGVVQEHPLCDPCAENRKGPRCPPDHCELQSLFGRDNK